MKKITLIACSFIFIVSGMFAQVNLQDGLVAYYPLDGNGTDFSPSNISGIVSGATPTAGKNGQVNTAFQFNGVNQFINCSSDDRGITDKLTVSCWINKSQTNTVGEHVINKFVQSNGTVKRGFYLKISPDGYPIFAGRLGVGGTIGLFSIEDNSASIIDGNWHHLLGTIDQNEWNFYVDGSNVGSITGDHPSPSLVCGEILSIGHFAELVSNYFMGSIDEVRLYNRILNEEEISLLSDISFVDTTYSVTQINKTHGVSLFPNPATDKLSIKFGNEVQSGLIQLCNLTGQIIHTVDIFESQDLVLDISSYPSGIYFIRIKIENDPFYVRKVIKK